MELSDKTKKDLEGLYQFFLHDERIIRMKDIPMQRGSNCYLHSFRVCKLAVKTAIEEGQGHLEAIITASILHDYYLYDWRKDKEKRKHHGGKHPFVAVENAERDFHICDEVKNIILCHMYPLNHEYKPTTYEEKLVAKCDTRIATKEFMSSAKHKERDMDKYYKEIEKLFD